MQQTTQLQLRRSSFDDHRPSSALPVLKSRRHQTSTVSCNDDVHYFKHRLASHQYEYEYEYPVWGARLVCCGEGVVQHSGSHGPFA